MPEEIIKEELKHQNFSMTSTLKQSPYSGALCIKMLKRDFPVLILSLLILTGFFICMKIAFSASIAIQEDIISKAMGSVQTLNSSDAEVFFGDELFEKELQHPKLDEPKDSRELKVLTEAPTLGERLKKLLKCTDRPLQLEKIQYGKYWLVRNYIRGQISKTMGCADTITLTTNGDFTFFDSLPFLVERWLAPVSFALFAPGYDFNVTMSCIQYVRNCLPESQYIRDYVTFHIYFPADHMPKHIPLNEKKALLWPYNCDDAPPYEDVNSTAMYRTVHNMTYPINVGRNIARKAANTHFIFASDIELSPTPNLPLLFLEMVESNRSVYLDAKGKRVYVLPVFEVTKDSSVPEDKTNLVEMLHNKTAIPFHSKICTNCHLVPMHKQWENSTDAQELTVFSQAKREGKFVFWEPFYISDNQEPMFDERVTWEGQSNKRIQGYAMCLLEYDYLVLHPAFLVHTPGIKYFDAKATRLQYVPAMNKLIKKVIEPEYRILYGMNRMCRT
ncbi:beta-1,4-glucuronyltransferase 1 isoform X1 [Anastrepha obliqua]|uniref:beta-1,4-glucuronyltransferase 1 isoform X1 n=2 Tax=Anastrepha obliqua TaxID=95512 RepID=UPI0024099459|nr:beta-1,4-glucuronyltransferase 1 isoform X1 [Anastrepha obliqua]